jgi:hypothetical protein
MDGDLDLLAVRQPHGWKVLPDSLQEEARQARHHVQFQDDSGGWYVLDLDRDLCICISTQEHYPVQRLSALSRSRVQWLSPDNPLAIHLQNDLHFLRAGYFLRGLGKIAGYPAQTAFLQFCRSNGVSTSTAMSGSVQRLYCGMPSKEIAISVAKNGFAAKVQSRYGHGFYLTNQLSKTLLRGEAIQYVIIADVFTGNAMPGHAGLSSAAGDFHCAVNSIIQPTVFVIFDAVQINPTHIMAYVSDSQ